MHVGRVGRAFITDTPRTQRQRVRGDTRRGRTYVRTYVREPRLSEGRVAKSALRSGSPDKTVFLPLDQPGDKSPFSVAAAVLTTPSANRGEHTPNQDAGPMPR